MLTFRRENVERDVKSQMYSILISFKILVTMKFVDGSVLIIVPVLDEPNASHYSDRSFTFASYFSLLHMVQIS